MRLIALALACLLPLASLPATASDAAVEARLTARGLKFTTDEDGDYKVVLNFSSENRTQLVYVSGTTDGVTAAMALDLLRESRTKKIGAWEISGDYLYYVIKIPDNVDAAQLGAAIRVAGSIADDKEIELSGDADNL